MEQDVEDGLKPLCCACLSTDRNLVAIQGSSEIVEVFKLLLFNYAADRILDTDISKQYLCWECVAIMKRISKFKKQVQNAQEHLRVLTLGSTLEAFDHTYLSQSLSSLECVMKTDYDRMYLDYTHQDIITTDWSQQYISISEEMKPQQYDMSQSLRDNITLGMASNEVITMPELVVENPITGVMSHIVVSDPLLGETYTTTHVKGEMPELVLDSTTPIAPVIIRQPKKIKMENDDKERLKAGYNTLHLTESEMLELRNEDKKKVKYASAVYKCELCIIGFFNQGQVEGHFLAEHTPKPGFEACKVCYVYVATTKLTAHTDAHYTVYECRMCGRRERTSRAVTRHIAAHLRPRSPHPAALHVDDIKKKKKKESDKELDKPPPKPGDLRKLLSKTTIVGYKCLECDMFFKTSRARKTHVARCHREGLQCDICKRFFVNKTTLTTHLKLHEGPQPREKCHICNKMVRVVQLKYHIRRHENKTRYECTECDKVFSHLATYQAHLKYARPHASEGVFKFPCPMCHKGYPTKDQMQDHFNYQHLGKTKHKCPICDKPIASKANVERHMARVHGEKKEKPRNHVCQECGKAFTDKKAVTQHAAIHSAERPLSCEICFQTFKQKASLYTHRRRVHKVQTPKRVVEFMDTKVT
ncbi:zinc finger protein 845-like [Aricia agestis]|uniref:zinc finger protein 845-like n=1 Tax=Aricia agestis TaxID=91739 RepID=UPI001C204943|nr:zinc finger protein 845-like [Aricia agestis]